MQLYIPNIKKSRLLFGKYSYTKIFSSSWEQHPKEPNKISVLEFGYELDFVFELCESLAWMWSESLDCYLQSLGKLALVRNKILKSSISY